MAKYINKCKIIIPPYDFFAKKTVTFHALSHIEGLEKQTEGTSETTTSNEIFYKKELFIPCLVV